MASLVCPQIARTTRAMPFVLLKEQSVIVFASHGAVIVLCTYAGKLLVSMQVSH